MARHPSSHPVVQRGRARNPSHFIEWLGSDPARRLTRRLDLFTAREGDLAMIRALRQFPDESRAETLRRLIGDDIGRTRDPGDRRILAYAAGVERGERRARIIVRVTEEVHIQVALRTRRLGITAGEYLRLLLLRGATLLGQGIVIAPDPDEPRRRPRS